MEEKNILPDGLNDAIKEHGLDLVMEVAKKTIGMDLLEVKPNITTEDMLRDEIDSLIALVKSTLKDDEMLVRTFSMKTSKWGYTIEKKPLEIDHDKHVRDLTEDDFKILSKNGFPVEDLFKNRNSYECGWADRDDDIFIIRTGEISWRHLAGREWHYNVKTKELKLVKMS